MKKSTGAEVAVSEWPCHDGVQENLHFSELLVGLVLPPIGCLWHVESFECLSGPPSNLCRDRSALLYWQ